LDSDEASLTEQINRDRLEQSPNCRLGDSHRLGVAVCRKDLNHLHTAVWRILTIRSEAGDVSISLFHGEVLFRE
jgi:hypothetical protein